MHCAKKDRQMCEIHPGKVLVPEAEMVLIRRHCTVNGLDEGLLPGHVHYRIIFTQRLHGRLPLS